MVTPPLPPLDRVAMREAQERHARLTKPAGALGRLEALGVRLAGIAGQCPPPLPVPAAVAVFAADHGVHAQGVTPWPQAVTSQMVANIAAGGAAINVFARQAGVRLVVVDVGVAARLDPSPAVRDRKVRWGTADLSVEPAMTAAEATAALEAGADTARQLVAEGAHCLVTGEMGIANTTASAAIVAAMTGAAAADVTGRGTGIDDRTHARKVAVVERALRRHAAAIAGDPRTTVAALGGLEIAALAGYIVAGAAEGVPVVIDGVVACAALLIAEALAPGVSARTIAGHRSPEPGASVALAHLGLEPLLDLELRLGEGTGACLALPLVEASARVLQEMATFDSAGVSDSH